jgi:hypothetical protein
MLARIRGPSFQLTAAVKEEYFWRLKALIAKAKFLSVRPPISGIFIPYQRGIGKRTQDKSKPTPKYIPKTFSPYNTRSRVVCTLGAMPAETIAVIAA